MHAYNKSLTATVYIVHGGKVLLHMHKKYATWFPVGGHLEPDELPHDAAIREAREESGLEITLTDTSLVHPALGRVEQIPSPFLICHEGIGHAEEFLDFIYAAVTKDSEPRSGDGESHTFRWFSAEELNHPETDLKPHVRSTALAVLALLGHA
jgi:8-oxo-dGTP pyrophosphatase MutT (NUDIX family)